MKQGSYWRVDEWEFLERTVNDPEVQLFVAKGEHNHARAVLTTLFRAKFTGPSGAESEDAFKKRFRWTKKARKGVVVRRRAETPEEWHTRMASLNDVRLYSAFEVCAQLIYLPAACAMVEELAWEGSPRRGDALEPSRHRCAQETQTAFPPRLRRVLPERRCP